MNPDFHHELKIFAGLLFIFILTGCNNNRAQQQFENDARKTPSGYTHTGSDGKIISKDPDDWRISPMFQGFVYVTHPPYPNPSGTTGQITFELQITGLSSIYGIYVYTNLEYGAGNYRAIQIGSYTNSPLDPGFYPFYFQPVQFSSTGNASDATGLHRIFVYDGRQNLITYGDIMIQ